MSGGRSCRVVGWQATLIEGATRTLSMEWRAGFRGGRDLRIVLPLPTSAHMPPLRISNLGPAGRRWTAREDGDQADDSGDCEL